MRFHLTIHDTVLIIGKPLQDGEAPNVLGLSDEEWAMQVKRKDLMFLVEQLRKRKINSNGYIESAMQEYGFREETIEKILGYHPMVVPGKPIVRNIGCIRFTQPAYLVTGLKASNWYSDLQFELFGNKGGPGPDEEIIEIPAEALLEATEAFF